MVQPDDLAAIFARRGALRLTSGAARGLLIAEAHQLEVERGETIVRIDDPPGGIYGVVAGSVACEAIGHGDEVMLCHVLHPGDWFGSGPIVTGGRRMMNFHALEPTTLIQLPLWRLRPLLAAHPELGHAMALFSERTARMAIAAAVDLLIPDAGRRLAAVLLRVCAVDDGLVPAHPAGIPLTQAEIGRMASMSRGHAGEALQLFQARGLVALGYGRIRITDPEGLRRVAAEGAHPSN